MSSRRAHLHNLARDLKRYLAWQKADGAIGFVPASEEERQGFEAQRAAFKERELQKLKEQISGGTPQTGTPQKERVPQGSTQSVGSALPDLPAAPASPARPAESGSPTPAPTAPAASKEAAPQSLAPWKNHPAIYEIKQEKQRQAAPKARAEDTQATAQVTGQEMTPEQKMEFLRGYLGDCRRCGLCEGRTNVVFGSGNPQARLMFIGEGPGKDEDLQGLPFVGASGQLLTKMIGAMGFRRDEVFIANVVKCRPPQNRDPLAEEIRQCAPFLKKQIEVVEPEVIVTLGRFAVNALLQKDEALGKLRGRWHEYEGVALMPTYHPAYLLRNEDNKELKRSAWSDLQMVMKRLNLNGSG